jgi:hypothetical protein
MRDQSGLSRRDFYFATLGKETHIRREILELGPDGNV